MALVTLENVAKSYGAHKVIHGADLHVKDGEFVVFVGPSGCGKSTLLRMISGLEEISSGEVKIGDKYVTNAEPGDRGVAMVFQSYALYPHMDVSNNMSFGLRMNGNDKADTNNRVSAASAVLQLKQLLKRLPKQLSGGQRQRVAIGRAIVRKPEVFLFDEPLSNLDAELRVQMRVEIARLHTELGATMIYVTHDQTEAMTLADRIVVLNEGQIAQVGTPLNLYHDPDNQFVAGFIGSPRMNFLTGRASAWTDGQQAVFLTEHDGAVVEIATQTALSEGSNVMVGVRPEHFVPTTIGGFTIIADVVEHLGAASFVYTRTSTDHPLIIARTDAHSDKVGDQITVTPQPGKALLFDDAGLRIR